ncbi:MAG UNVERIFIED_CONTAM: hypothetical protein LVR18_21340 [Planctomycetaceae bacterium]
MATRKTLFNSMRNVCVLATFVSINSTMAAAQQTSPNPVPDDGTITAAKSDSLAPVNLAGRWRGNWHSDSTGHKGPMQASFQCAGAGQWKVVFRGRFCCADSVPVFRGPSRADECRRLSDSEW